ncbi:MAG: serine hydrolase [Actinomycetes bacterium]
MSIPRPAPRRRPRIGQVARPGLVLLALLTALVTAVGCGAPSDRAPTGGAGSAAAGATPVHASPFPTAARTSSPYVPPPGSGVPSAKQTATTDISLSPAGARKPPSLAGNRRNAWAFAPLDDPSDLTVEGRVSSTPAWSTSKVLVVAAFLDTAVGGDPDRVSARNRRLVRAALTKSDADAVLALRAQIRGRPGRAMTAVLRSIGDRRTTAPDSYQGRMRWSVREQVRFMAALSRGRVVSRSASAYLRDSMRPIKAHAWGLGTIDASAYKGGWLRGNTPTRQLGIVEGYAVAIITDAVGPAVRQTDGDSAHVRQMNRLARMLRARLAYEAAQR